MQWLIEHPQYLLNQLFIGADSYSGISAPIVVKYIVEGNFMMLLLKLNLISILEINFQREVTHEFETCLAKNISGNDAGLVPRLNLKVHVQIAELE
jgi:hypothetical protein